MGQGKEEIWHGRSFGRALQDELVASSTVGIAVTEFSARIFPLGWAVW